MIDKFIRQVLPQINSPIRVLVGRAKTNIQSWCNLVGWRPVHGIWQPRRYHLRLKSAFGQP